MARRIRNAFERFWLGAGSGEARSTATGEQYVVTEDDHTDVETEDGDLVDWG